jgi:hypothetical protein
MTRRELGDERSTLKNTDRFQYLNTGKGDFQSLILEGQGAGLRVRHRYARVRELPVT